MRFLILLLLWLPAACLHARELVDARGQPLLLEKPAQRIVVLAPNLAEDLDAIGALDRVVGRVAHTDYPAQVAKLPLVGDYQQFNVEAILSLNPDLVLAWQEGNPEAQLRKLEAMGLEVFRLSSQHIRDIPDNLIQLGRLTGQEAQAEQAAAAFHRRLAELEPAEGPRPRLFYLLWDDPLLSVSNSTLIGEAIAFCGADNLFAERPEAIPQLNMEAVIAAQPDLIVSTNEVGDNWRERWLSWKQIPAVARQQLVSLEADYLHRATPRFLSGLDELCKAVSAARAQM
ncbi:cobalamin-binding protein [Marinobacterium sp. YM272]|uniref:cobalamin-binding protein n=1 Tax=Marinobacterium sp. YM272 TaxID=3421654 RepID=UPI003D7FDADC